MALLSSLLHLCGETPSVTGESNHHGANVTLISCLVLVLNNQEDKTIPLLFHCILVSGLYSFSYWMNRHIEHVDMFSFANSAQWCIYIDTSEYGINIAFNNDIFSSFFHHQAQGLNRWWLIVLTLYARSTIRSMPLRYTEKSLGIIKGFTAISRNLWFIVSYYKDVHSCIAFEHGLSVAKSWCLDQVWTYGRSKNWSCFEWNMISIKRPQNFIKISILITYSRQLLALSKKT